MFFCKVNIIFLILRLLLNTKNGLNLVKTAYWAFFGPQGQKNLGLVHAIEILFWVQIVIQIVNLYLSFSLFLALTI